jgi:hypothetical protein
MTTAESPDRQVSCQCFEVLVGKAVLGFGRLSTAMARSSEVMPSSSETVFVRRAVAPILESITKESTHCKSTRRDSGTNDHFF